MAGAPGGWACRRPVCRALVSHPNVSLDPIVPSGVCRTPARSLSRYASRVTIIPLVVHSRRPQLGTRPALVWFRLDPAMVALLFPRLAQGETSYVPRPGDPGRCPLPGATGPP